MVGEHQWGRSYPLNDSIPLGPSQLRSELREEGTLSPKIIMADQSHYSNKLKRWRALSSYAGVKRHVRVKRHKPSAEGDDSPDPSKALHAQSAEQMGVNQVVLPRSSAHGVSK